MSSGVQSSYPQNPAVAYQGMIAESFFPRAVESKYTEGVAGIGMGVPVEAGSTYDQAVVLATPANFYGVSVKAEDMVPDSSGDVFYAEGEMLPVMQSGRIWVVAGGAITVAEVLAGSEVIPQADGKFDVGANAGAKIRAYVVKSSSPSEDVADGDLIMVQLSGPQTDTTA